MNTADTTIYSESTVYAPREIDKIGDIPIFAFPWVDIPFVKEPIRTDDSKEPEKPIVPEDVTILELARKYYDEHKQILLKKYRSKYIAILDNKVVGSDKDFSKLAQRAYKKYGYQTIYIPFVDAKEKIIRIPSPRAKI